MTWMDALGDRKVYRSIFQRVGGRGSQNDNMLQALERMTGDRASINDLYQRQRLSREILIAVLKARIIRRLC